MTPYSGDEFCGDEIISPDTELLYAVEAGTGRERLNATGSSTKGSLPASPPATCAGGAAASRGMAEVTKPGSCWLCDGTGRVEVADLRGVRSQVCMACVNEPKP